MRRATMAWKLVLVLTIGGAGGCGGPGKPVKVQGTITLDGQPLAGATITFMPMGNGRSASGRSDADGHFRLGTYETEDGALPGEYRVVVTMDEADQRHFGENPEEFSNQDKLEARMSMSPKGKRKATQAKKAAVSPVPTIYGDVKRTPLREVVPPPGKVELALQRSAR